MLHIPRSRSHPRLTAYTVFVTGDQQVVQMQRVASSDADPGDVISRGIACKVSPITIHSCHYGIRGQESFDPQLDSRELPLRFEVSAPNARGAVKPWTIIQGADPREYPQLYENCLKFWSPRLVVRLNDRRCSPMSAEEIADAYTGYCQKVLHVAHCQPHMVDSPRTRHGGPEYVASLAESIWQTFLEMLAFMTSGGGFSPRVIYIHCRRGHIRSRFLMAMLHILFLINERFIDSSIPSDRDWREVICETLCSWVADTSSQTLVADRRHVFLAVGYTIAEIFNINPRYVEGIFLGHIH